MPGYEIEQIQHAIVDKIIDCNTNGFVQQTLVLKLL